MVPCLKRTEVVKRFSALQEITIWKWWREKLERPGEANKRPHVEIDLGPFKRVDAGTQPEAFHGFHGSPM